MERGREKHIDEDGNKKKSKGGFKGGKLPRRYKEKNDKRDRKKRTQEPDMNETTDQ